MAPNKPTVHGYNEDPTLALGNKAGEIVSVVVNIKSPSMETPGEAARGTVTELLL